MTNELSNKENSGVRPFGRQLELAQTGAGSDWMDADQGIAFAEYGLSLGLGVSKMEAYAVGAYRGKLQLYHQILGLDDDGENWEDHKNPKLAIDLVKTKILEAASDELRLRYKFWLDLARSD